MHAELWCGSAPEGKITLAYARATTCRRLCAAVRELCWHCEITMMSWPCSPPKGVSSLDFGPLLRGWPFFCQRTCYSSASPADAPEVFATPYGAVAGGHAATGGVRASSSRTTRDA